MVILIISLPSSLNHQFPLLLGVFLIRRKTPRPEQESFLKRYLCDNVITSRYRASSSPLIPFWNDLEEINGLIKSCCGTLGKKLSWSGLRKGEGSVDKIDCELEILVSYSINDFFFREDCITRPKNILYLYKTRDFSTDLFALIFPKSLRMIRFFFNIKYIWKK